MVLKETSALYRQALSERKAIAFYCLPGATHVNHISGTATRKIEEGQRAFAFAPFDPSAKPYYITDTSQGSTVKASETTKVGSTSRKEFTDYVKNVITKIRSGSYQKVVAARVFAAKRPSDFAPLAFFDTLCKAYPGAFVSLTHIPGVGTWIGASPEVLASQTKVSLTTYALAGTKAIDDGSDWSSKERQEQQIVTDFIHQKLAKAIDADIKLKGPETQEAGSLKHLLTVFTLRSKEADLWQKAIKALHPTPAVAGMPQTKAIRFIKDSETFDRRYYAGYLGPVNQRGRTDLYVNLRCMEVTDTQLLFYAGCGITADSDPVREWLESERKINVLRSLI